MEQQQRASAGGIVKGPDGRIALVCQHGNSWSFPKGQIEEGETSREAAVREIEEETGITDLEYVANLGSYERYSIGKDGVGETPEWGMKKRTLFLFTTNQHAVRPNDPDGEITEVRYVLPEEALELLTHPKDKEFLKSVWSKIHRQ